MIIKLGTAEYLRAQACKNSTQALKCSCNHAQRCLHAFTTLPGQPASPARASTWHPGRSARSFHSLPTLPPRSAPPSSYCHHRYCLPSFSHPSTIHQPHVYASAPRSVPPITADTCASPHPSHQGGWWLPAPTHAGLHCCRACRRSADGTVGWVGKEACCVKQEKQKRPQQWRGERVRLRGMAMQPAQPSALPV